MEVGCYKAAYELGIKLTKDIRIIGFNDIPSAKYMISPLTIVLFYMEFVGEYVVHLWEESSWQKGVVCESNDFDRIIFVR